MQVRRYDHADRAEVMHLHRVALEAVGAYLGPGPWDADLDDIGASYLRAGGEFLVGVIDEAVVAMGGLRRIDDTTAELKRMRVSIDVQGQGLGRAMLRGLDSRAAALGFRTLVLDTSHRQLAALALYRSEGYLHTGDGEIAGLPVLYFRKDLTS